MNRNIYGEIKNFRPHQEFLYIIESFTKVQAKKIILDITQDYNNGTLFKKDEKIKIKTDYYKLLAVGGYGIVFKSSNIPYEIIKITLTHEDENKDYTIPNKLISENSYLEKLIMVPKTYMEIKLQGLYYYIYVQYFIIFIIDRSIRSEKKIKKSELNFKIDYEITNRLFKSTIDFKPDYLFLVEKYLKNIYKIDFITNKIQLERIFNMFKKYDEIDYKFCTIFDYAPYISSKLLLDKQSLKISKNGIDSFDTLILKYDENTPLYSLRILFISVSFFLLICNKTFSFFHNDLKLDNILVMRCKPYKLKFEDKIFSFNIHFKYLINDFGISTMKTKFDKKYAWFYDMHFFVHMLFIYLEDRVFLDNEMAIFLFETFIKPFCSKTIEEIREPQFKKIDVCENFYYKKKVKFDIKQLKEILDNSLFDIFRCTDSATKIDN